MNKRELLRGGVTLCCGKTYKRELLWGGVTLCCGKMFSTCVSLVHGGESDLVSHRVQLISKIVQNMYILSHYKSKTTDRTNNAYAYVLHTPHTSHTLLCVYVIYINCSNQYTIRVNMVVVMVSVLGLVGISSSFSTTALRTCRPSPPCDQACRNMTTCLIIGDSVSLGMMSALSATLNQTCRVLHAPFSGDGGACDTRHA